MHREGRSLLLDCVGLIVAASVPVLAERLSGLQHAPGDLWSLFIPNFAWWWTGARWLGGWNQWIFGGYPGNADPQAGQLHPFGLLYALAAPLDAAALEGALAPAAAAVGMLLYLRQLGCPRVARLTGALSFGLGGFIGAQAEHAAHVRAALAVPWALAAIETLDGAKLVAGLGAATAAIVLGGHPQLVVYSLTAVVLYAVCLGRAWTPGRAVSLACGLVLGVAIGAAVWLPAVQLIGLSTHGPAVEPVLVGASTAPEPASLRGIHLAGLVVPFAGGGGAGPLYGRSRESLACSPAECGGYPGMLVLLAVLAGSPSLLRRRHGRFWLVVGFAGVVLATGVVGVMPPLRAVRAPARLLLWWNLGAAAAAGLALRDMPAATETRAGGARWWLAGGVVATLVALTATRGPVAHRAALGAVGVLALSLLVVLVARRCSRGFRGALLVVAAGADLLSFRTSMPVGVPAAALHDRTAVLRIARDGAGGAPDGDLDRILILPFASGSNWAPFERIRLLQGYNALVPQSLASLLGHNPRTRAIEVGWVMDPRLAATSSHVLDLLRCRTVVVPARARDALSGAIEQASADGTRWGRVDPPPREGIAVYVNGRARPVAWLVPRVRVVSAAEALRLVRGDAGGFDPAVEALAERPVVGLAGSEGGASAGAVRVLGYEDDEIRLLAETPRAALLVTSEVAYPGWTARVGGETRPVVTVNAGFRAVEVPAGRHEVVLTYRPWTTRVGFAVAAASALVLVACAVRWRR